MNAERDVEQGLHLEEQEKRVALCEDEWRQRGCAPPVCGFTATPPKHIPLVSKTGRPSQIEQREETHSTVRS
jgi:hypothetical protein